MNENYDIIIVGSGLVGTSLIAALKNANLRIAVLETHLPTSLQPNADSRPLTLNYSSQQILETLGIWTDLAELAEPVNTVHVSEQNHFGTLIFRAAEENVPALGYVVPFDTLQDLLYQRAAQISGIQFITIQQLLRIQYQKGRVLITVKTVAGEKTLESELLAVADGTHSPARKLLGIPAMEKSCGDVALTLTADLTHPHGGCGYERFTAQGIVAVLPLKNPQRCRIVWTLSSEFAATVLHWSDQRLMEYLQSAMRGRLGEWRIIERGKLFNLQTVLSAQQIQPGVVLLGNAAHTLYPLAAQGFNLALRDVATLAEILLEGRQQQQVLGSEALLKAYIDWREDDQRWISGLTSYIGQVFELRIPGLGSLRSAGLLATHLIPPLKHRLAKRLLGMSGKCPKLARGIAL